MIHNDYDGRDDKDDISRTFTADHLLLDAEQRDPIAERLAMAITILLPRIILRELAKEASCLQMPLGQAQ